LLYDNIMYNMTKKTRLIILFVCVACFLIIAPVLVFYSMGYRFDFEKMQIVATGGIYVRTFPAAGQITIDSNIPQKPGLFANSIFVQSLLPKDHTISIKKDGYYDYFKTLPVQEKEVTKLENVLLIKKSIEFRDLADKISYFSITPNNQNIITATTGTKNITFSYYPLNATNQPQTFSITQIGKILDIKWSDDSNKALIKIQNYNNNFYYLFDTTQKAPLKKTEAVRLSYLDKNTQQISFNPQDSQTLFYIKNKILYSAKGNNSLPIINNIISFKISGTNIIWLSTKGTLSNSDISGKLIANISSKNFSINNQKTYEIISIYGDTFLKEDNALFKLKQDTKTFENFSVPITSYKILTSPDNKNLIYWDSNEIYLYSFIQLKGYSEYEKIFSGGQITNCQWLNNDYIILTAGDKIIISEIDYRGNINAVTLPQTAVISSDKKIEIKSPEIFFNQQENKLYILTNTTLLVSEKLVP